MRLSPHLVTQVHRILMQPVSWNNRSNCIGVQKAKWQKPKCINNLPDRDSDKK